MHKMKDEKAEVSVCVFTMIGLSHLLNIWEIFVDNALSNSKNKFWNNVNTQNSDIQDHCLNANSKACIMNK